MAKPSANVGDLVKKIYDLIIPESAEDRKKIFTAVAALCGDAPSNNEPVEMRVPADVKLGPVKFFEEKSPKGKIEELAAAARYRELGESADTHTKEDLKTVFKGARRNFDAKNFPRDISNAQHNAGFFLTGAQKGHYQLSYRGQQFVDNLPNREAANKHRKSSKTPSKKKD